MDSKSNMKKIALLVSFCLVCFLFCFAKSITNKIEDETIQISYSETTVGGLENGTEIRQSFCSDESGLSKIKIKFATYARINHCNIHVSVIDDSDGTIVTEVYLSGENIQDNQFQEISFPPIQSSKGKQYTIAVTTDADPDNSLTIWKTEEDYLPDGKLTINGMVCDGDLNFEVYHNKSRSAVSYLLLSLVISMTALGILAGLLLAIEKISKKMQWILCVIASLIMSSGIIIAYSVCFRMTFNLLEAVRRYTIEAMVIAAFVFILNISVVFERLFSFKKICDVLKKASFIGLLVLSVFLKLASFVVEYNDPSIEYNDSLYSEPLLFGEDDIVIENYIQSEDHFNSISNDSSFLLPGINEKINCVTVYLMDANITHSNLLWAINNEPFDAYNRVIDGIRIDSPESGITSVSMLVKPQIYSSLKLNLVGEFTLVSIKTGMADIDYNNSIRFDFIKFFISLAADAVIILLIFAFKWKDCILSFINKEKKIINTLKQNKIKYVFHVIFIAIRLSYVAVSIVLLYLYSKISIVLLFVLTIICVITWIVDRIRIVNDKSPATLFLIVSLCSGWMMAYSLPLATGVSHDDVIHFASSVKITDSLIGGDAIYVGDKDLATMKYYVFNKPLYMDIYRDVLKNGDELVSFNGYEVLGNNPLALISYAPVVVVSLLKRLTGMQYFMFIMLSRFSNCILYSAVSYLAIKRLRSSSLLFSAIMLMPTCIFLASNYSYDYWVTAFISYSIAYFIGIMQDRNAKFTFRDWAVILLTMLIGCGPKAIYCTLLLPFMCVGKEKFSRVRSRRMLIVSCVLVAVILAFSLKLNGGVVNTDTRGGNGVNAPEQVSFILSYPLRYTEILLNYLNNYFSIRNSIDGLSNAGAFAYINGEPPAFISTVILLVIAYAAFTDRNSSDRYKGHVIIRIAMAVSVFAALCLICTALYITYTPVGCDTINGVQWRYCIPLLFPTFYAFSGLCGTHKVSKSIQCFIIYSGMFLAAAAHFGCAYVFAI